MRAFLKTLLVLEVAVCFGPAILMLMIGALLIPIQVMVLFVEPVHWKGPVLLFGSVLCGAVGLGTLFLLLDRLCCALGTATIEKPWFVFAGAVVGVIPLIDMVTSSSPVGRIVGAMPIVSGLHLLFLSRRILFPPSAKHEAADAGR